MIAPVEGSGLWPAWIARVPRPCLLSFFMVCLLISEVVPINREAFYTENTEEKRRTRRNATREPWEGPTKICFSLRVLRVLRGSIFFTCVTARGGADS